MFESLQQRLDEVFGRLSRKGKLTEKDVTDAMREVRQALLEADVNFKLVKQFVARVQERAIGQDVLGSLSPAQQVIGIVHDELVKMLGGEDGGQSSKIQFAGSPPTVIMLVGLQGSGKTTHAAKLAQYFRKNGQKPGMVAADMQRPAAVAQLQQLGRQLDIPVYSEPAGNKPVDITQRALKWAREQAVTILILDTAGRLHIDDDLMREVATIRERTQPNEVLLVVDAMTGQDAVRVADEFNQQVGLTGLILTKMDGDARGGAALSVREVTGVPIKFLGTGEKTDALEPFYPDRLATRILGMGDVMTLIEKAREQFDEQDAAKMQKKMATASFNLEDFLNQMRSVKKMGPLTQLLEMIPGMGQAMRDPQMKEALEGDQMKMAEAIILSMTLEERRNPDMISGSRKRRIAAGSGTTPQDVNQLLTSFKQSQKMMKQVMGMQNQGRKGRRGMLGGMGGMGGVPGLPGGRGPFGI
ncbi:MAG TPA: signal recognition particle protein [Ktedonobacterales bacterium]|jgi:signal recognition particle subunit SRP54|nr:signal recognition particle protein [Ktedonobacterales bacterium]